MKSVLLVGIGRFGTLLAVQIGKLGHQVMAVDKDEENITPILPYLTGARIGDSTNEAFLRGLGVDRYDLCMVAIGDDFLSSLETVNLLKELGARKVIARAEKEMQEKFLLRNGADEVVNPALEMARWTAIRYTSDHILDYTELDDAHAIFELAVPKDWEGRTVGQIDIRKRFGVTIMALKEDGHLELPVTPDTLLSEDKTMLVLGRRQEIQKCFKL